MRRILASLMAVLVVVSLPMTALAAIDADTSYGDVKIHDDGVDHYNDTYQPIQSKYEDCGYEVNVSHGSGDKEGTVYVEAGSSDAPVDINININTKADTTTDVVLHDAHIDTSNSDRWAEITGQLKESGGAAIEITGEGTVVVELEGDNSLTGGAEHAGLEVSQEGGSLTIRDGADRDIGELTTQGGMYAAGIGGGIDENGSNITIESGKITATGGDGRRGDGGGAGIGGGLGGDGVNIEITGGTVNTEGGRWASGIGGGHDGVGSKIHIGGDASVKAEGSGYSSGIGGGRDGDGTDITIDGNAQVQAVGGSQGAGIGGGSLHAGSKITIGDNAVVQAEGGLFASGIGGGNGGTGTEIVILENAQVTAVGKENAADIGNGKFSDTEKQPNNVNTDGLTTGKVIYGRDHGPQNPDCPVEQKPAASSASAAPVRKNGGVTTNGYKKGYLWSQGYITRTLFKVENGAGMKPFWSEEIREGILTITAENEPVVFTTWLNGLKYLYEMGIRTIVIKTGNCETTLDVAKLIAENASEYILIQKGENATLTLDGKSAEIE